MENPYTSQCFYNSERISGSIDKNVLLSKQVIYDVLVIYYFITTLLSNKHIITNTKEKFNMFIREFDYYPVTNKEKSKNIKNLFSFCFQIIYMIFYCVLGFYAKSFFLLNINKSSLNLIQYIKGDVNNLDKYIISITLFTIISLVFDKSLFNKTFLTKILFVAKSIFLGSIIYLDEKSLDILQYLYFLTIKFEIFSLLITFFIL